MSLKNNVTYAENALNVIKEIPIIVTVWRVHNSKFTLNIPQEGTKDSFMVIVAIVQKSKFNF